MSNGNPGSKVWETRTGGANYWEWTWCSGSGERVCGFGGPFGVQDMMFCFIRKEINGVMGRESGGVSVEASEYV